MACYLTYLSLVFLTLFNNVDAQENPLFGEVQKQKDRNDLCMLCDGGLEGLQHPDAVIKNDGTTCTHMAMLLPMTLDAETDECLEEIETWRQTCCGDAEPEDVEVTEPTAFYVPPDPDDVVKTGPHDRCNLCKNGRYPPNEGMVLHLLYLGAATCPEWWSKGLQGDVPNHMCAPLQFFAQENCGCYATKSTPSASTRPPSTSPGDDRRLLDSIEWLLKPLFGSD